MRVASAYVCTCCAPLGHRVLVAASLCDPHFRSCGFPSRARSAEERARTNERNGSPLLPVAGPVSETRTREEIATVSRCPTERLESGRTTSRAGQLGRVADLARVNFRVLPLLSGFVDSRRDGRITSRGFCDKGGDARVGPPNVAL